MIGTLTYLDIALLAVAFISGLLAMYRGVSREILSILSWVAGALFGLWLYKYHPELGSDIERQFGLPEQIAQAAVAALGGLIVLIVVELITARISDAILDSQVGMIDRVLGFLFGLGRGFLLMVIPYMIYVGFYPEEDKHHELVLKSQSLPYVRATGFAIRDLINSHLPSSLTGQGGGSEGTLIVPQQEKTEEPAAPNP